MEQAMEPKHVTLAWINNEEWYGTLFQNDFFLAWNDLRETHLHTSGYCHPLTQNLMQMSCAHCVPQCCLCQESCWMMCILNIGNGYCCIWHAIVDNGIHWHRNAIFGQDLCACMFGRVYKDVWCNNRHNCKVHHCNNVSRMFRRGSNNVSRMFRWCSQMFSVVSMMFRSCSQMFTDVSMMYRWWWWWEEKEKKISC